MTPGHLLDRYATTVYRDGGRGPVEYDCWGLVREARHLLGFRLLPSWGHVRHTAAHAAEFTRAYRTEADAMEQCTAEHGAIAACFRGRLCVHTALVIRLDGRLSVLETCADYGFRRTPIRALESRYLRVIYYRDRILPEQTGRCTV